MNTQKDLSYFNLRLKEVLQSGFPELIGDTKFIDRRARIAAEAYEEAFRSGNSIDRCGEIAEYLLFEGLHFSKFDTLYQVVCREFDTIMADEELRPFAMKMLQVCEPVFERYTLTDDFAYTLEFDLLYTELTGMIQIWIEDHGL